MMKTLSLVVLFALPVVAVACTTRRPLPVEEPHRYVGVSLRDVERERVAAEARGEGWRGQFVFNEGRVGRDTATGLPTFREYRVSVSREEDGRLFAFISWEGPAAERGQRTADGIPVRGELELRSRGTSDVTGFEEGDVLATLYALPTGGLRMRLGQLPRRMEAALGDPEGRRTWPALPVPRQAPLPGPAYGAAGYGTGAQ